MTRLTMTKEQLELCKKVIEKNFKVLKWTKDNTAYVCYIDPETGEYWHYEEEIFWLLAEIYENEYPYWEEIAPIYLGTTGD